MNIKLTFEELVLVTPFIHMKILAGWSGKENHFYQIESECEKITRTGIMLVNTDDVEEYYLKDLLNLEHVRGIIIYGNVETSLQSTIRKQADELKKPLLYLHDMSKEKITEKFTEIFLLKKAGLFHILVEKSALYWTELLANENISHVHSQLKRLIHNPIVLLNPQFQIQTIIEVDKNDVTEIHHVKREYYNNDRFHETPYQLFTIGNKNMMLFRVAVGKKHYGFLLVKEVWSIITSVAVDQVLKAIPAYVTAIKHETELIAEKQKYKYHFIYDLLHNNLENARSLVKQGMLWEMDFTKPTQLMVMKITTQDKKHLNNHLIKRINIQIKSTINKRFLKSEVTEMNEQFVIIVFDTYDRDEKERIKYMKELADELHQMMTKWMPQLENTIGLGKIYASNIDLFRSYQEAKTAIEIGRYLDNRGVFHFNDLGMMRLLASVNTDMLVTFYKEHLTDLLTYDQESDTNFMETLEIFYRENGDVSSTANSLYVHPNTLRNRLKKIESLLDIDFNKYEDLLNVYVTLKIYTMFKR